MSLVLQDLLVAVLVAAAAAYSAWRLLPLSARLKLLTVATPLLSGIAAAPLARARSRTMAQLAAGCSACSGASRQRPVVKH